MVPLHTPRLSEFNGLRYYSSAAGKTTALSGHPPVHGTRSTMFGFFDSFKKGCGCALGVVAGLVIAGAILTFVSMSCEITGF